MNNTIKEKLSLYPHLFVIGVVAIFSVWNIFNNDVAGKLNVLRWDSFGYNLYLPATFIYKDVKKLRFVDTFIDIRYHAAGNMKRYGPIEQKTGYLTNKYPLGVAMMEMPLFLLAHSYTRLFSSLEANGYTYYYQLSVQFSAVVFCLMGLYFLCLFLQRYFSPFAVCLTLFGLFFGTNIFYYTLYESGMSHIYSFFLFSSTLYFTDKIFLQCKASKTDWACLGLTLGLAIVVRQIDLFLTVIPVGIFIYNLKQSKSPQTNIASWFVALGCFLLPIFIQFCYWKATTNHWLYYSYQGEHFNFLNPQVINGLFSYRKGWFIYTPLSFIMCLTLVYMLIKNKYRTIVLPIFIFSVVYIYIVFCWENWYYGGSYGCRALIQLLAPMSFPLCYFIESVIQQKNAMVKVFCGIFFVLLLTISQWQTHQYKKGIIHYDSMTQEMFWGNFFRLK